MPRSSKKIIDSKSFEDFKPPVTRTSVQVEILPEYTVFPPFLLLDEPQKPGTGGFREGTGRIPKVPDEFTVVSATSHEGSSTKPRVPDEEKKKDKDGDVDDEGDDHISDIQDTNDEDAETESEEDDIYKYKICVSKNEDEEKLNADVKDFGKGDAEIFDVAKADDEKIEEIKDDAKKAELPPTSSSLFVSSGIGDQFLKLPSDISLVSTIKDTADAEINSLLDFKIQSEVLHIQSPSVLTIPVSVISEPFVLTPIPITPSVLRVSKLENDVSKLNKIDHSAKALATLKSQVPTVIEQYLGSKIGDDLQKC
ncbi:hypothetical protein Tco_0190336 [Tanacetum coccineum]